MVDIWWILGKFVAQPITFSAYYTYLEFFSILFIFLQCEEKKLAGHKPHLQIGNIHLVNKKYTNNNNIK